MFRKFALITFVGVLALVWLSASSGVVAQEIEYFFAYNRSGIVTYSTSGQPEIIAQLPENFEPDFSYSCNQLAPQAALFWAGESSLWITTETAVPLKIPESLKNVGGIFFWKGNGSYAVFFDDADFELRVGVLVNNETGSLERLTGKVRAAMREAVRFSLDGRYLYYVSLSDDKEVLWKRELESGTEQALSSWTDGYIVPNSSGEFWLHRMQNSDEDKTIYTLVTADGTSQIVKEIKSTEHLEMRMVDDALVTYPLDRCESGCSLEVLDLSLGEPSWYTMPDVDDETADIRPRAFVGNSELLLTVGEQVWLLKLDGPALSLGYMMDVGLLRRAFWSPDRRLIVTALSPNNPEVETAPYHIWDTELDDFIWDGFYHTRNGGFQENFATGWLLFESLTPSRAILYQYADHELITLPERLGGMFVAVLSDGKLLYIAQNDKPLPSGLYLFDLATGTDELLLPGLWGHCENHYSEIER